MFMTDWQTKKNNYFLPDLSLKNNFMALFHKLVSSFLSQFFWLIYSLVFIRYMLNISSQYILVPEIGTHFFLIIVIHRKYKRKIHLE